MVGRTPRVVKAPTRFQDDNDFYLIKFTEDGLKRVLTRDKVKIDDEAVETGSTCQAYWEDSQNKGWFEAIILAFGDSYENLTKAMHHKKTNQDNSEQADPKAKQVKRSQPKQRREDEVIQKRKKQGKETKEEETEKKRKEQQREVMRKKKEELKKKREAIQQQRKEQFQKLRNTWNEKKQSEDASTDSEEEEVSTAPRKHVSKSGQYSRASALAHPGHTQLQQSFAPRTEGTKKREAPQQQRIEQFQKLKDTWNQIKDQSEASDNDDYQPISLASTDSEQEEVSKSGQYSRASALAHPGHTPLQQGSTPGRTPLQQGSTPGRTPLQQGSTPGRTPLQQGSTPGHTPLQQGATPGHTPLQLRLTPISSQPPACPGRTPSQHNLIVSHTSLHQDFSASASLSSQQGFTPIPATPPSTARNVTGYRNEEFDVITPLCSQSPLTEESPINPPPVFRQTSETLLAHRKRRQEGELTYTCTNTQVDWQEEYSKLHRKYSALKEKVRILEQSSHGEDPNQSNDQTLHPGIINPSEAQKYKMIELSPGTAVFWYLGNKNAALSSTKTAGELTAFLMDTFFTKDIMAVSNMRGGGTKGYQQLKPLIITAMRGFVLDDKQYGKQAGMVFSKTVQDKCCGARRGITKMNRDTQ